MAKFKQCKDVETDKVSCYNNSVTEWIKYIKQQYWGEGKHLWRGIEEYNMRK